MNTPNLHYQKNRPCSMEKSHEPKEIFRFLKGHSFYLHLIGIVSLIWLVLRSGFKPSRLAYPCQRAAMTGFLSTLAYWASWILLSLLWISSGHSSHITQAWNRSTLPGDISRNLCHSGWRIFLCRSSRGSSQAKRLGKNIAGTPCVDKRRSHFRCIHSEKCSRSSP